MLEPIVDIIHRLVDQVAIEGHADESLHDNTMSLVLMALGDAMMGAPLAKSLGLPRDRARDIAARMLVDSMEKVGIAPRPKCQRRRQSSNYRATIEQTLPDARTAEQALSASPREA